MAETAEERIRELEQALGECHSGREHEVKKLNDGIADLQIKFNALDEEHKNTTRALNANINGRASFERYIEKLKKQLRDHNIAPVEPD